MAEFFKYGNDKRSIDFGTFMSMLNSADKNNNVFVKKLFNIFDCNNNGIIDSTAEENGQFTEAESLFAALQLAAEDGVLEDSEIAAYFKDDLTFKDEEEKYDFFYQARNFFSWFSEEEPLSPEPRINEYRIKKEGDGITALYLHNKLIERKIKTPDGKITIEQYKDDALVQRKTQLDNTIQIIKYKNSEPVETIEIVNGLVTQKEKDGITSTYTYHEAATDEEGNETNPYVEIQIGDKETIHVSSVDAEGRFKAEDFIQKAYINDEGQTVIVERDEDTGFLYETVVISENESITTYYNTQNVYVYDIVKDSNNFQLAQRRVIGDDEDLVYYQDGNTVTHAAYKDGIEKLIKKFGFKNRDEFYRLNPQYAPNPKTGEKKIIRVNDPIVVPGHLAVTSDAILQQGTKQQALTNYYTYYVIPKQEADFKAAVRESLPNITDEVFDFLKTLDDFEFNDENFWIYSKINDMPKVDQSIFVRRMKQALKSGSANRLNKYTNEPYDTKTYICRYLLKISGDDFDWLNSIKGLEFNAENLYMYLKIEEIPRLNRKKLRQGIEKYLELSKKRPDIYPNTPYNIKLYLCENYTYRGYDDGNKYSMNLFKGFTLNLSPQLGGGKNIPIEEFIKTYLKLDITKGEGKELYDALCGVTDPVVAKDICVLFSRIYDLDESVHHMPKSTYDLTDPLQAADNRYLTEYKKISHSEAINAYKAVIRKLTAENPDEVRTDYDKFINDFSDSYVRAFAISMLTSKYEEASAMLKEAYNNKNALNPSKNILDIRALQAKNNLAYLSKRLCHGYMIGNRELDNILRTLKTPDGETLSLEKIRECMRLLGYLKDDNLMIKNPPKIDIKLHPDNPACTTGYSQNRGGEDVEADIENDTLNEYFGTEIQSANNWIKWLGRVDCATDIVWMISGSGLIEKMLVKGGTKLLAKTGLKSVTKTATRAVKGAPRYIKIGEKAVAIGKNIFKGGTTFGLYNVGYSTVDYITSRREKDTSLAETVWNNFCEGEEFGSYAALWGMGPTTWILKGLFRPAVATELFETLAKDMSKLEKFTSSKMLNAFGKVKASDVIAREAISFGSDIAGFSLYEIGQEMLRAQNNGQEIDIENIIKNQFTGIGSFKIVNLAYMAVARKFNGKPPVSIPKDQELVFKPLKDGRIEVTYPGKKGKKEYVDSYEKAYELANKHYEDVTFYKPLDEEITKNNNRLELDKDVTLSKTENGYVIEFNDGRRFEADSLRGVFEKTQYDNRLTEFENTLVKNGEAEFPNGLKFTYDKETNTYSTSYNGEVITGNSLKEVVQNMQIKESAANFEQLFNALTEENKDKDKIQLPLDENTVIEKNKDGVFSVIRVDSMGNQSVITGNSAEEVLMKAFKPIEVNPETRPVTETGGTEPKINTKQWQHHSGRSVTLNTGLNPMPLFEMFNAHRAAKALRDVTAPWEAKPKVDRPELNGYRVHTDTRTNDHSRYMADHPELFGGGCVRPGSSFMEFLPANKNKISWKMHLYSVDELDWQKMCEVVIPYLRERGVEFKTLNSLCPPENLGLDSEQRGKAFTIYPHSKEEMAQIAKDLDYIIRNNNLQTKDSRIIGDRMMGTSGRLFYRYEYKSKTDMDRILNTENPADFNKYDELYEPNRGGDNYLASDMTKKDDIWYNFNPADPASTYAGAAQSDAPQVIPAGVQVTLVQNTPTVVDNNIELILGTNNYRLDLSSSGIKELLGKLEPGKTITVGRGEDCDIHLFDMDGSISRKHLIITKQNDGKLVITDISANGTRYVEKPRSKANGKGERVDVSSFKTKDDIMKYLFDNNISFDYIKDSDNAILFIRVSNDLKIGGKYDYYIFDKKTGMLTEKRLDCGENELGRHEWKSHFGRSVTLNAGLNPLPLLEMFHAHRAAKALRDVEPEPVAETAEFRLRELSDAEFEQMKARVEAKFQGVHLNKYNVQLADRVLSIPELCDSDYAMRDLLEILKLTSGKENDITVNFIIDKILSNEKLQKDPSFLKQTWVIINSSKTIEEAEAKFVILDKLPKYMQSSEVQDILRCTYTKEQAEARGVFIDRISSDAILARNTKLVGSNWVEVVLGIGTKEQAEAKLAVIDKIMSDSTLYNDVSLMSKLSDIIKNTATKEDADAKIAVLSNARIRNTLKGAYFSNGVAMANKWTLKVIDKILSTPRLYNNVRFYDIVSDYYTEESAEAKLAVIDKILSNPRLDNNKEFENLIGSIITVYTKEQGEAIYAAVDKIFSEPKLYNNKNFMQKFHRFITTVKTIEEVEAKIALIDKILSDEKLIKDELFLKYFGNFVFVQEVGTTTKNMTDFVNFLRDAHSRKDILRSAGNDITDEIIDYFLVYPTVWETAQILGVPTLEAAFPLKLQGIRELADIVLNLKRNLTPEQFEILESKINPANTARYKQLQTEITALKKSYPEVAKSGDKNALKELQNKIATKDREAKEIMAAACKLSPQEIINKIKVLCAISNRSKEAAQKFLDLIKDSTPENEKIWRDEVNRYIFEHMGFEFDQNVSDRLNFGDSRYIGEILSGNYSFCIGLCKIIQLIKDNPDKSMKEIFDALPQNIKTREMFEKLGLNYDKFGAVDERLNVNIQVKTTVEKTKKSAIESLENDFNEVAFMALPEAERNKIYTALAENGFELKVVEETVFDDNGVERGKKKVQRLYKDGKPITLKDAKKVVQIVKDVMNSNEFWTTKSDDETINSYKETMYTHFIKDRSGQINTALDMKEDRVANLTIRKTDMNNVSHSLFLGNHGACCTAVGTGCNQFSAPTYIMNKMVTAIEVVDGDNFVGNTMCYIAEVDGKPALILDNIELKAEYHNNDKIRDAIFEYAFRMCEEMGMPDMEVYAGPYRHKLNMENCFKDEHSMKLVGNTGDDKIYLDFITNGRKVTGEDIDMVNLYKISRPERTEISTDSEANPDMSVTDAASVRIKTEPATVGDLRQVHQIDRENFRDNYDINENFEDYNADLQERGVTTKVFKNTNGDVIGYYQLEPVENGELYIYSIGVPKNIRNTMESYKILKSMQDEITRFARANNIQKLTLDVDASNETLVRLYKRFGFEIVDETRGFEGGREYHDYHMEISLNNI